MEHRTVTAPRPALAATSRADQTGSLLFLARASHGNGITTTIVWFYTHPDDYVPGEMRMMTGALLTVAGRDELDMPSCRTQNRAILSARTTGDSMSDDNENRRHGTARTARVSLTTRKARGTPQGRREVTEPTRSHSKQSNTATTSSLP